MLNKWVKRIVAVFLIALAALTGVAAALPVPEDTPVPDDAAGAGASSVEPSYSGLQREFPSLNAPADNPSTPEKIALGEALFYDPVLSAGDDIACATCHHPDYGFADGLPTAVGRGGSGAGPERTGGQRLERNTPSLWNVAYRQHLFWDGRETSLEAQALFPLTHADEMGAADTEALLAELARNEAYVAAFDNAFDDGITLDNVQRALAAFQRTLISDDSPFDRYAAGEIYALTPEQRRGLALFRSGATRCFECHAAPTFDTETFRVIGVPSDDPGRAGVSDDAPEGAFRVPSLRNVALTAPYMHDGSLGTLEEVVDFYAEGGGNAFGRENVDQFVAGFELTEQERADLVAFLYALTDERALPERPESVPSGGSVVPALVNPARTEVAIRNVARGGEPTPIRAPQTITVRPGGTIQAAVDRARPGDTVLVPPGVYHETVVVDQSDLTLQGIPSENGDFPVLDGQERLFDGIISSGNNFTVGNFVVRNYRDNGVLVEGVTGVHFHDIRAENTGTYGIYPVQSTDVLIERVVAFGTDDAGIYAGQCENVVVRDSEAFGNVIGLEFENTIGAEVTGSRFYDNTVGVFVVVLPNLTSKVARDALVKDNVVENNNHENFAPENATAALLPPGVGVLVLGADNTEVTGNVIRGNKSTGVAVFSLTSTGAFPEIDVGPNPEGNWIHGNSYENNGYDPADFVADLGVPTGDILWDGSGWGNHFDEPEAQGNFPPVLPGSGWPTLVKRIFWQAFNALIGLLG